MTCEAANRRLVELARLDLMPDAATARHLTECSGCQERWEAERELTLRMNAIRSAVPVSTTREARKRVLMAALEPAKTRSSVNWFAGWRLNWVMPLVAAMMLLSVVTVRQLNRPAVQKAEVAVKSESDVIQEAGFILVPYSIPLAAGESVRIVQTQLQPDALMNLGIDVDPAWNGELRAELLVGEDGVPRAVRISDEETSAEMN